jgi:hypothetical protein
MMIILGKVHIYTPFRPATSAMYPLATAPIMAPIVSIDPKTEYCGSLNGDEKTKEQQWRVKGLMWNIFAEEPICVCSCTRTWGRVSWRSCLIPASVGAE